MSYVVTEYTSGKVCGNRFLLSVLMKAHNPFHSYESVVTEIAGQKVFYYDNPELDYNT